MRRSTKPLMLAAAVTLSAVAAAFDARPATAAVNSTGRHRAIRSYVAVRTTPDGPARDNLELRQSFVVTSGVGSHYVYGYKFVNGVHGYVLSSSLEKY